MTRSQHSIEQEDVMAYLDGELTPGRAAAVAAHLEECGDCRILAEELRGISQQLLAWDVQVTPEQLIEPASATFALQGLSQAKNRFKEGRATGRSWWRTRPAILALGTASAVVVFVLWVVINTRQFVYKRAAPATMALRSEQSAEQSGGQNIDSYPPAPGPQTDTGPQSEAQPELGPMIVRTASLTLVSKQIDSARVSIETIVTRNKGYIAKLEVDGQPGVGHTLTATLRVPANQLDSVLSDLKKIGQVSRESQNGEEVTSQYVDLNARLANARRTENRLIELLAQRTGKLSDVLDVEKELGNVREEIERMDAQRKTMENQVQFAEVEVVVTEEYSAKLNLAPGSTGMRLRNAIVEGWQTTVQGILAVVVFLLNYGLSLLFWTLILFWPLRWIWRRFRAATVS